MDGWIEYGNPIKDIAGQSEIDNPEFEGVLRQYPDTSLQVRVRLSDPVTPHLSGHKVVGADAWVYPKSKRITSVNPWIQTRDGNYLEQSYLEVQEGQIMGSALDHMSADEARGVMARVRSEVGKLLASLPQD